MIILPGYLFDIRGTAANTASFATSADELQPSASKAVTTGASRLNEIDLNDHTKLYSSSPQVFDHFAT